MNLLYLLFVQSLILFHLFTLLLSFHHLLIIHFRNLLNLTDFIILFINLFDKFLVLLF